MSAGAVTWLARVVTPEYPTAQQRNASPVRAIGNPHALDSAEGHPKAFDPQSVGSNSEVDALKERIGTARDVAQRLSHGAHSRGGERKAVSTGSILRVVFEISFVHHEKFLEGGL